MNPITNQMWALLFLLIILIEIACEDPYRLQRTESSENSEKDAHASPNSTNSDSGVNPYISDSSTHTIGGTIVGLTMPNLILQNNAGDDLIVLPNTTQFTFSTPLDDGAEYRVSILQQPDHGQTCQLDNHSGTLQGANITDVMIHCSGGMQQELMATWYGVQSGIFEVYCTSCHGGTSPQMGINLEVDQYDVIVTQGQTASTGAKLVTPNEHTSSYLYDKIVGMGEGNQMPLVGGPLPQNLIDKVVEWIDHGAPLGDPNDTSSILPQDPPPQAGTFEYTRQQVFFICTTCHTGNPDAFPVEIISDPESPNSDTELIYSAPKGIEFDADDYEALIADQTIDPNNLEESKAWKMIFEDVDKRMPWGMEPLSQEQKKILRDYILDGAPEN